MTTAHASMASLAGPDPILERVKVDGTLSSTFARIKMTQAYRNMADTNVEIVYTFPLPPQSTLLDVVTELNGKRHRGTVMARAEAEEGYEGAIEKGDTTIMVERPEPGLYVMNLGNLMAGETATIEVEFVMLLDWHRNQLRLSLPMTLAPRYDEEHSKLEDHQKPGHDLLVERPFELELRLSADFAGASVSSPTHRIATRFRDGGVVVALQRGEAWMDKDFVLTAECESAPRPYAVVANDGDDHVLYASVQVPPAKVVSLSRDVKIVLDCSGSMQGDSISLAREGVLKLLDRLRAEDRFGLVAFGSHTSIWARSMLPASEDNLEAASAWVRDRQADMGGTEMAGALQAAVSIPGAGKQCDVFLITDGQIGRTPELAREAQRLGHRIFVVGVGSAPQQDPLHELAEQTGGAIEWVTPGEDIVDAVRRIFSRLVEIPVSDLRLACRDGFAWETRTPARSVFTGDTVHFCAGLRDHSAPVHVEWRNPDGGMARIPLECRAALEPEVSAALPRVAAAKRIRDLQRGDGVGSEVVELATRYQLVTSMTNYLLIVDRDGARVTALPEIRRVRHMMSASMSQPTADSAFRASYSGVGPDQIQASLSAEFFSSESMRDYDAPQYSLKPRRGPSIRDFIDAANKHHASLLRTVPLATTLRALSDLGLHDEMLEVLRDLARLSPEMDVVLAFWTSAKKRATELQFNRGLRRSLRQAGIPGLANVTLVHAIDAVLERLLPAPMVVS